MIPVLVDRAHLAIERHSDDAASKRTYVDQTASCVTHAPVATLTRPARPSTFAVPVVEKVAASEQPIAQLPSARIGPYFPMSLTAASP